MRAIAYGWIVIILLVMTFGFLFLILNTLAEMFGQWGPTGFLVIAILTFIAYGRPNNCVSYATNKSS